MGNENDSREAYQARVSALGRAYADALLSADEGAAEIAIREAMEAGLDTAQIDDEIIAPALWHVGDLWQHVIALRMSTTSCATRATTSRCSAPTSPPRPLHADEPPAAERRLHDLHDVRTGRRCPGHDRRAAAAMAVDRVRHRRGRPGLAGAIAPGHRRLPPRVGCRGGRGRDDQGRRAELGGTGRPLGSGGALVAGTRRSNVTGRPQSRG
jgi:hypothetical protein